MEGLFLSLAGLAVALVVGLLEALRRTKEAKEAKEAQEREEIRARLVKQSKRRAQEVINAHPAIIKKFLALAETKVATLDEYGDENWKALSKEITQCIGKLLAAVEGTGTPIDRLMVTTVWSGSPRKRTLVSCFVSDVHHNIQRALEERFRAHHTEESVRQRDTEEIARMTGVEFETYLMRVLKQHGCSVRGTPPTGDRGADLVATFGERVIVVQAKRSAAAVGTSAIQEVVAAVAYYNATEAWVITNSTFTKQASELAQRNAVRLVSGAELPRVGELLQKSASA